MDYIAQLKYNSIDLGPMGFNLQLVIQFLVMSASFMYLRLIYFGTNKHFNNTNSLFEKVYTSVGFLLDEALLLQWSLQGRTGESIAQGMFAVYSEETPDILTECHRVDSKSCPPRLTSFKKCVYSTRGRRGRNKSNCHPAAFY